METITPAKQIFFRLINADSEIDLSKQVINELYFNARFQLLDYCLGDFDREDNDLLVALTKSDIEFDVVFDGDDDKFIETILVASDRNSAHQDSSISPIQVMHVIHLPANDAMKLRNILLTKTKLNLHLTIFFSTDSILTAMHQLDQKKSTTVISCDFSLLNHTK